MTAQTLRLYKEARSLWWPWLLLNAVGVLGAITAAHPEPGVHLNILSRLWRDMAVPLGSFVGIPLIATMIFGLEFQHRTFPLLLAQPLDRMQLWNEKMRVMLAAVIPPAIIFCTGWSFYAPHLDRNNPFSSGGEPAPWIVAALCLTVATAAAPFWTLVARTTLGSMVLNGLFPWATLLCFVTLYDRAPALHSMWGVVQAITAIVMLAYAALMFWLGRRLLARYQVTAAAGGDLLIDAPVPMPRFVEEAFRCRPSGLVLNLVRKELRLLRPVFVLTLFSAIVWVLISAFSWLPANEARHATPTTNAQTILLALAMTLTVLIAVLAGTVSLGEERTSGTHAWHMTLPASSRLQWIAKLLVGISASVICGALLPLAIMMVRGFAGGSLWRFAQPEMFWVWPLALSVVTMVAFWSACSVNGAVRASLWLFPIAWALGLSFWLGASTAEQFGFGIAHWLLSRVDPFGFGRSLIAMFDLFDRHKITFIPPDLRLILTPLMLVMIIQSYFLFRQQVSDSKWRIARALIPGAVLLYLIAFCVTIPMFLAAGTFNQADRILRDTHVAIQQWQTQNPQLAAGPAQIAGADVARQPGVSERTGRWMAGAAFTVVPLTASEELQLHDFWTYVKMGPDSAHPAYAATVRLANGNSCVIRYQQYPLHPNLALSSSFANHGSVWAHCN